MDQQGYNVQVDLVVIFREDEMDQQEYNTQIVEMDSNFVINCELCRSRLATHLVKQTRENVSVQAYTVCTQCLYAEFL